MKSLKSKPALKIVIPFIAGIVAAYGHVVSPMLLLVVLVCITIFLIFTFIVHRFLFFDIFALIAFFVIGLLLFELRYSLFPHNHIRYFTDQDDMVCLEGVIRSPVVYTKGMQSFVLRADSLWVHFSPRSVVGNVKVKYYGTSPRLHYGQSIVLRGHLYRPDEARNPGAFNYRKYLEGQNIYASMSSGQRQNILILRSQGGNPFLRHFVYPARRYIIRFVQATLPGQQAAILKGLLVGAREQIDYDLREAFANVGVIHVLAVSGLHVGFILLGLIHLFSFMGLGQSWRTLLVLPCLLFYAYLTGPHPPVVRASIMATIILLGALIQRPTDIINSLSVAALIILCLNPMDLFGASFQLSFVAVAGIVLIYKKLHQFFLPTLLNWKERGRELSGFLSSLFFVSLAAQLATLPLTAYYFGRIALIALPANLLVVPAVGIIVALGFVSVFASLLYWPVGVIYANANGLFIAILIHLVRAGNRLPFSHLEIARPTALFIVVYFLLLLLFLVWQRVKFRNRLIIFALLLLNISIWSKALTSRHGLQMTFFDVGQGDAALFRFADDRTLLVDAGECNERINYGERVIAPYLQRSGIRCLNTVLITHAHSDHIGGVPYLMQHFKVGRIVESPIQYASALQRQVDSLAAARKIPIRYVSAGDTLAGYTGTCIFVLNPDAGLINRANSHPEDLNDGSVVVKIQYGHHAVLMMGDAEKTAERQMLRYGNMLECSLLKVGHHGSPTSSTPAFVRCTRPAIAVVSVGRHNRLHLPSANVLQRWQKSGARVFRTDLDGAEVFFTDGVGAVIRQIWNANNKKLEN